MRNRRYAWRYISLAVAVCLAVLSWSGCGNKVKLNPQDLTNYLSAELKADRTKIKVNTNLRTAVVIDVSNINVEEAHVAQEQMITAVVNYFRRDGVNDFLNDSLVFMLKNEVNPSQYLRWTTVADDARQLLDGAMSDSQFLERMQREETWNLELEEEY